jgi:hypothetical protein
MKTGKDGAGINPPGEAFVTLDAISLDAISFVLMLASASALGFALAVRVRQRTGTRVRLFKPRTFAR